MLKTHFDYIEKLLLAQSGVVNEAGHSIHKGTPREYFIRDFLQKHLGERVAFGTGEIIDADSKLGESRNQIDIVIYRPDFPRLDLGGGINVFLAESVIATIEVKSKLNKKELRKSIEVANRVKQLKRDVSGTLFFEYSPLSIVSYVVAYDGPAKMDTVYSWLGEIHNEIGITIPELAAKREKRTEVKCPSIDAVFVLGKGFMYFDNTFTGYESDPIHKQNPDVKWIFANSEAGNVFLLFVFLMNVVSGFLAGAVRLTPYLRVSDINLQCGK